MSTSHKSEEGLASRTPQKTMGVLKGISFLFSNMVGAGIFMSPDAIARQVTTAWLILFLWFLGGVIVILGAFCYVELGIMFPENGGEGVYFLEAFGGFLSGFYYTLIVLLTFPGGNGMVMEKVAKAIVVAVFNLNGKNTTEENLLWLQKIVGTVLVLILGGTNIVGPKISERLLGLSFWIKVATLSCIILGGIIAAFKGVKEEYPIFPEKPESEKHFLQTYIVIPAFVLMASFWSYEGWNTINMVGGQVVNPRRNFPIIVVGGLMITTFLYLVLNSIYLYIVPKTLFSSHFLEKEQSMASKEQLEPIKFISAELLSLLLPNQKWFTKGVFPLFIALSLIGGYDGCFMAVVYMMQAGTREGFFMPYLDRETKEGIPWAIVLFQQGLSLFYLWCDFPCLFSLVNLVAWGFYGLAAISIFFLRKRKDLIRSFTVWSIVPIIFSISAISILVIGLTSIVLDKKSPFYD